MYMYINLAIDVIVCVIDFCFCIHTVHLRSRLHKPRTPENVYQVGRFLLKVADCQQMSQSDCYTKSCLVIALVTSRLPSSPIVCMKNADLSVNTCQMPVDHQKTKKGQWELQSKRCDSLLKPTCFNRYSYYCEGKQFPFQACDTLFTI